MAGNFPSAGLKGRHRRSVGNCRRLRLYSCGLGRPFRLKGCSSSLRDGEGGVIHTSRWVLYSGVRSERVVHFYGYIEHGGSTAVYSSRIVFLLA